MLIDPTSKDLREGTWPFHLEESTIEPQLFRIACQNLRFIKDAEAQKYRNCV
jgi:hypothetical protein